MWPVFPFFTVNVQSHLINNRAGYLELPHLSFRWVHYLHQSPSVNKRTDNPATSAVPHLLLIFLDCSTSERRNMAWLISLFQRRREASLPLFWHTCVQLGEAIDTATMTYTLQLFLNLLVNDQKKWFHWLLNWREMNTAFYTIPVVIRKHTCPWLFIIGGLE